MFRTIIRCANTLSPAILQKESIRCVPEVLRLSSNLRQLSLSARRYEDQRKRRPRRDKDSNDATDGTPVSTEVQEAAVKAAKSLPGDWTKTAEELLARLQTKNTEETESGSQKADTINSGARSLLSTMKVGRSFERDRKAGRRGQKLQRDGEFYSQSIEQKSPGGRQVSRDRRTPVFKDLFGVPRLGIFEAKKKTEVALDQTRPDEGNDLWAEVERAHIRRLQGGLPRNAFEEMIRLTEEGKVWTFPVDNEADLHEERKYKFHDHVFLERHLTEFPSTGPVRKFMELVTLGLSQNPWLTVPEKLEHIAWFAQYFKEKQEVLKSALGEQGEMKEAKKG